MSEKVQYHIQRFEALKKERSNFDSQWEEAAELIIPSHRTSFTGGGSQTTGEKKTELQFDSTASFAAQRCSSVIESLITPQSSIWHLTKAVDPVLRRNRQVRRYFDDLNEVLFSYRYRPGANFVGNSQQVYLGLAVYGNGSMYVDEPDNKRGLRYKHVHLGEIYFAENHENNIDTAYRCLKLTAKQIIQMFRNDSLPEGIQDIAANPSMADKKYEVLHCVYPRSDYSPVRVDSKGKPFASLYIFTEKQHVMREGGYDTFPFVVARSPRAPGEMYGRGPAQWVLPAIKVLNEEKRTVLKQGHRQVDPVLLAHDDGVLDSFSMKAGAINKGGVNKDGKMLVQALPTGNLAIGDKLMDMEKGVINDAFLITLFQILVDTPQMTATEVLERAREKGMLLAPMAGALQAGFLGPMIEREISILSTQPGVLPTMPPILRQAAVEYRVEYDSPMSRMMRSEKAAGFMRALDTAANYAKMTGDMEALDHFNFDVAMPEILDINGAPTAWTRTVEDIQQRREQRAEQAQTQQMIEAAPSVASMVKGAA